MSTRKWYHRLKYFAKGWTIPPIWSQIPFLRLDYRLCMKLWLPWQSGHNKTSTSISSKSKTNVHSCLNEELLHMPQRINHNCVYITLYSCVLLHFQFPLSIVSLVSITIHLIPLVSIMWTLQLDQSRSLLRMISTLLAALQKEDQCRGQISNSCWTLS